MLKTNNSISAAKHHGRKIVGPFKREATSHRPDNQGLYIGTVSDEDLKILNIPEHKTFASKTIMIKVCDSTENELPHVYISYHPTDQKYRFHATVHSITRTIVKLWKCEPSTKTRSPLELNHRTLSKLLKLREPIDDIETKDYDQIIALTKKLSIKPKVQYKETDQSMKTYTSDGAKVIDLLLRNELCPGESVFINTGKLLLHIDSDLTPLPRMDAPLLDTVTISRYNVLVLKNPYDDQSLETYSTCDSFEGIIRKYITFKSMAKRTKASDPDSPKRQKIDEEIPDGFELVE